MTNKKPRVGAKGKYQKWIDEDGLIRVAAWKRDGLTDEQIAANMGIHKATFYDWQKKFPEFSDAVKKGKDVVDRLVENALFKNATGYSKELKKNMKVKRVIYNEDGKKVAEIEEVVPVFEEVHIPGNTTAQMYWLGNRKPEKWKDVRKVEAAVSSDIEDLSTLKDMLSNKTNKGEDNGNDEN